ncbi:hypothetical protein [Kribbella italica]|uniref:Uncharacterized protein n=1 Tax=Kribbella italica TaxID=1540520 RepID=A0A7W9JCY7_9ACTN|nr:hypothetical protein [Kribbella italica]MBB5839158.1 hypothetical protein [Kribbella italica]
MVALVVAFAPVSAGAAGLEDEPKPTSWPTVEKPSGSVNQSDPRPVSRPTVDRPETAQSNDPRPNTWPAPERQ